MSTSADAVERRKLRTIARRYEREGYRVMLPGAGEPLPPFLEGFQPDLIAERDNDRVVVEVKRSDAVRGANDLLELAERIAGRSGWRFELVTVPVRVASALPSASSLETVEGRIRQAVEAGLADLAYLSAYALIETMVEDLAARNGLASGKAPLARLARDLVSKGLLAREDAAAIERARSDRDRLLHDGSEPTSAMQSIGSLLALAGRLRGEMASEPGSLSNY